MEMALNLNQLDIKRKLHVCSLSCHLLHVDWDGDGVLALNTPFFGRWTQYFWTLHIPDFPLLQH